MNKYLHKWTDLSVSHRLNLFDRHIMPILNYGGEVWGFFSGMSIERVHMQFCKQIIGVKRCTQNDCVYGELCHLNCQSARYVNIIKYWIKLIRTSENKFTKKVYLMLVMIVMFILIKSTGVHNLKTCLVT